MSLATGARDPHWIEDTFDTNAFHYHKTFLMQKSSIFPKMEKAENPL